MEIWIIIGDYPLDDWINHNPFGFEFWPRHLTWRFMSGFKLCYGVLHSAWELFAGTAPDLPHGCFPGLESASQRMIFFLVPAKMEPRFQDVS